MFVCIFLVPGIEPSGAYPLSHISGPFLYFIQRQDLAELCRVCCIAEAGFELAILLPQPPKLLGLQVCCRALRSIELLMDIWVVSRSSFSIFHLERVEQSTLTRAPGHAGVSGMK